MTLAYFDDGTVFSTLPFSELAANIVLGGDIIRPGSDGESERFEAGQPVIDYTETPAGPVKEYPVKLFSHYGMITSELTDFKKDCDITVRGYSVTIDHHPDTYTAQYNENECDAFAADILLKLGAK